MTYIVLVSMRPEHFHSGNLMTTTTLVNRVRQCFNEAGAFSLR